MKPIFYSGPVEDNIMTVQWQHNFIEMLSEEAKSMGIIITLEEHEPQLDNIYGKEAIKKIDLTTNRNIL